MIVTLTANPSLDRTVVLSAPLQPGRVQQASSTREDAGGKGVNVARVVAAAGHETLAVLPLADTDPFDVALRAVGVRARRVPVTAHARANVTIADPEGVTTKLNLAGAGLTAAEAAAVIEAVSDACSGARWLVLAGSLPPGVSPAFYVDVIHAVRERLGDRAPRVAVDTSGDALRAVVERGAPDLIKPNDEELAALAGEDLDPQGDLPGSVLAVARRLVPAKAGSALVTLGGRGAVLVEPDAAWFGAAPRIAVASTVGAGDSALAGYLLADVAGRGPAERLRTAIRYGAAAASLPGTQAPSPSDLPDDDVTVSSLI